MSKPPSKPKPKTKTAEPSFVSRALADRIVLLRLSFLANVGLVCFVVVQPFLVREQLRVPQRAIILDRAGSFSVSPLIDLDQATDLHRACARGAMLAAFERNPNGLDRPDQVTKWFTPPAREKIAQLVNSESAEFRAKQFFQKVVLTNIELSTTGPETFVANLRGQLIRTGVLNERVHVETLNFDIDLPMVVNPDMASNQRYPYAAWDLDVKYSR